MNISTIKQVLIYSNKKSTHKKIKIAFILCFLITGLQTTHAQFLKKLKQKAQEKIEREAERRAQRRVDKKIDDAFNKAEETLDGKTVKSKNNTTDTPNLAANYQFEWKYVLKMESERTKGKGDMNMIYYLSPNSPTFATKFEVANKEATPGNMLTIMDPTTGASVMLMEMDGKKIRQNMPSFSSEDANDAAQQQAVNDYTIVKTDTKTILGYQCQGFKITSSDGVINMYIAQNAPVSFNNTMSGDSKFKPKGFDPKWLKEFKNGLMMEMQFTSNQKEKYNMKMTCIELVKEPLTINMSAYKSMF